MKTDFTLNWASFYSFLLVAGAIITSLVYVFSKAKQAKSDKASDDQGRVLTETQTRLSAIEAAQAETLIWQGRYERIEKDLAELRIAKDLQRSDYESKMASLMAETVGLRNLLLMTETLSPALTKFKTDITEGLESHSTLIREGLARIENLLQGKKENGTN